MRIQVNQKEKSIRINNWLYYPDMKTKIFVGKKLLPITHASELNPVKLLSILRQYKEIKMIGTVQL